MIREHRIAVRVLAFVLLAVFIPAAIAQEISTVSDPSEYLLEASQAFDSETDGNRSTVEEIEKVFSNKLTCEPIGGRLTGLIIGIDPGHQAHANSEKEPIAPGSKEMKAKVSSGTSGYVTHIDEYQTDLTVALLLRDALEEEGATVCMTRESNDVDISNLERAVMMNELGADLVLRIHCDGSNDHSVRGTATYVRKTGTKHTECETAAHCLLDAMCEETGAQKRGVFLRDTYTGLNWSEVPCVLVEMGYMSNSEEDVLLNDPEYQHLLVQGMVNGIAQYFGRYDSE